jgi:flagellar basal body rod protein FlgG
MNVGLYSGAAGMKVGEDYQQLITENLSLQSVPGYRQTLPVFSTDPQATTGPAQQNSSGNPASVRMTRVTDFSQGPVQTTGNPYDAAIEGKSFFEVREADGSTTYTRNGSFTLSKSGQLRTTDGASVMGKGGSPISIDVSKATPATIGSDGTISIDGVSSGALGLAHFDNPSASLQQGPFGRYVASSKSDAHEGLASNDHVMQGALEQSNGNTVTEMVGMIQAMRLYEANQKSVKAVDDNANQLITNLGGHAQA